MCFFDKKQLAIPIQRIVSSVRAQDTRVYLSRPSPPLSWFSLALFVS